MSTTVNAAVTVPYKINFQGRLTNISGTVLTGSYDMQFKLYTTATVGSGTYVWGETRTAGGGNAVTVTNGLFNVLIGEGTAVAGSSATLQAAIAANATLYLEVTVGGEILSQTGSLRSQFGSSAYSINSDMLDGIDGSAFGQLSGTNSWTGAQTVNIASAANAFQVKNGSTNLLNVDTSNSIITLGTSDTTGAVLVLDVKTDAGDPTGSSAVIGAMYYNSNAGKFRCYQGSAWADCIGATTTLNNLGTTSINQSLIAGTSNSIDLGTSSATWKIGYFGTSLVTPTIRPLADSATALQIQNAAGTSTFLSINTTTSAVELGSSALAGKLTISDGSSNKITLSVNALASDYTISIPTITANDTMCLLTNNNCATTLQVAYNVSTGGTTPEIKVNSTKGGVTIQDADTTIAGTLFSVTQSNGAGLGTSIFSVGSTGAVSLGLTGTTTTLPGDVLVSTGSFTHYGTTALFKASSLASNAFQIQNNSGAALLSGDTSSSKIVIGSTTTDTTQILLQLDSFDTYADTLTCGVGTNQGGLYYNTKTNAVRGCINGGWEDMVSTASLGLQLFGVVPDSGLLATQGDIYGVSSATAGPCKVSVGINTSTVSWTACTAFSGGRKVIVTASTMGTTNTVAGNFQHLCLTGTNSQPTLSTTGAENANLGTVSFPSAAAPILCLADIKFAGANSTITEIYDTRTYTTTDKTFVALNSAIGIGTIVVYSGTKGVVALTSTASSPGIAGVVVATTGAASTTSINAVMATGGPAAVKATAGTLNNYIFTSTSTIGYAFTSALKPTEGTGTIYNVLGNARTAYSSACAANSDSCQGSLMTDIDKR